MTNIKYKRVLLKISGEGISGKSEFGLAQEGLEEIARQITELVQMGVQPGVVVGAGNLVRGAVLCRETPVQRVTGDKMGMLATVINALALRDVLENQGTTTYVMSAINMTGICEPFDHHLAKEHLKNNCVIILAGGTGNPFFTTDTCAALRASEIQAELLIKATKVDGVYTADPVKDPSAKKYEQLTFIDVLQKDLRVMDHTAISMCRENSVDILVCNLLQPGTIARACRGEKVGTLITH